MTVSLVRDPGRNHEGRFQPDEGRPPIIAVDEGYNLDKSCRTTSIFFPLTAPAPLSPGNLNLIVLSSAEIAGEMRRVMTVRENSYGLSA